MRNIVGLKEKWLFYKGLGDVNGEREGGEEIVLPHSWNAVDGQDGGNDYFRGNCLYVKKIAKADLPEGEKFYLEIRGANSSANVYFNG